jgi:hypothetical protein
MPAPPCPAGAVPLLVDLLGPPPPALAHEEQQQQQQQQQQAAAKAAAKASPFASQPSPAAAPSKPGSQGLPHTTESFGHGSARGGGGSSSGAKDSTKDAAKDSAATQQLIKGLLDPGDLARFERFELVSLRPPPVAVHHAPAAAPSLGSSKWAALASSRCAAGAQRLRCCPGRWRRLVLPLGLEVPAGCVGRCSPPSLACHTQFTPCGGQAALKGRQPRHRRPARLRRCRLGCCGRQQAARGGGRPARPVQQPLLRR